MSCDQVVIPIACRFVASDQWLTAQFDTTWKISEVKQYILSKVYNRTIVGNDNLPSEDRPVSPITFASARNSYDGNPDFLLDDDPVPDPGPYNSFSDLTRQTRARQTPTHRVTSPSAPDSPMDPLTSTAGAAALPPHHYPMLAFSTGQILEDDYSLAWYRLRPHELLELHPPGTIVRLQREVMLEYVKPYLELDVRALRVITSDKDKDKDKDSHALSSAYGAPDTSSPNKIRKARETAPSDPRSPVSASGGGCVSPGPQSMRKRKKMRLEWRERYLVIRQGMLSLFKSRTDLTPVHTCSLAMLTTLRGQEDVVHAASSAAMPSPHVVCARFRSESHTSSPPEPQSSPSPTAEHWNDPWSGGSIPRETDGFFWGRRESKDDLKQQRRSTAEGVDPSKGHAFPKEDVFEGRTPDAKCESLWYDINVGDGTQGTWLVLDTLDGFAHSNLLRVLHRCSPATISTTLIPSYLLPDSSFSSPSSFSSTFPSYTGALRRSPCPYPEWRIEVSQRAQQSGLGDLNKAMNWILCGGPPLGSPNLKYSGTGLRKKPSQTTSDSSSTPSEPFDFDADIDDKDGGECELEWDLWATDLTRQALAIVSNNVAVTVTEPVSIQPTYPHRRIRPTASSSTFSSVTMPELSTSPASPTGFRSGEIPPGANMGLLSVDSPALLTAPGVLPFQGTGVTTSTVSAGGIVRTRSLISIDGGRGRGVARAMEILAEDGSPDTGGHSPGKQRTLRRKRTREDNSRGAIVSSAPAHSTAGPSVNTITSTTVTVHESGTPSPTQTHGSPFWEAPPGLAPASTSGGMSMSVSMSDADDSSTISGYGAMTTSTTTTTTTIQLLPRQSSMSGDALRPEASSPSQKRGDKAGKGKGKAKEAKSPIRVKTFSPERLVSKLDSALDFVTG